MKKGKSPQHTRQGDPKNASSIPWLTSAARKASTSLWKVSKRRLRACLGDREQSSALVKRAPSTVGLSPLCPLYLLMVCLMGLSCRWM